MQIGKNIYNAGTKTDVLVAMNPVALKVNVKNYKRDSVIIIDSGSFDKRDLLKAKYKTEDPLVELGIET